MVAKEQFLLVLNCKNPSQSGNCANIGWRLNLGGSPTNGSQNCKLMLLLKTFLYASEPDCFCNYNFCENVISFQLLRKSVVLVSYKGCDWTIKWAQMCNWPIKGSYRCKSIKLCSESAKLNLFQIRMIRFFPFQNIPINYGKNMHITYNMTPVWQEIIYKSV